MASVSGADAGHAAQMDAIYRTQRHIYDLTRKYYLLGRDRLIRELAVPEGGSVLEVGCGTGRNLILTARRYPHARLYGFDISRAMLESAEKAIARAGLSDRITLAQGDATDFSAERLFGVAGFDRVFCSYTLSMIPGWEKALGEALAAATPGGEVHVVDFGDQAALPGWFKAMLRAWLAKFHVAPRDTLERVAGRLAAKQGADMAYGSLYRGYAQSIVLRR